MSLLSNRGRFTRDRKNLNDFNNFEEQSSISVFGVNPKGLFELNKNNTEHKDDIKDRLKKIYNKTITTSEEKSSHEDYNKKLKDYNKKENENDFDVEKIENENKKSKKNKIITFVSMFIVEVLTIIGILSFGTIFRYLNMTQKIKWNSKEVDVAEINEIALASMKGYKTVAIFGVDSRTGSVDKGNNADVNLIANLNMETGEIQLISVYRDLYLSITDDNLFGKLNSAYRKGGPQQAVKALNKNFDLKIVNYFSFNWKAVADAIELLGGIDIEITKSEFRYLNAFIHETCVATGIDNKNPAAHYIKSHGYQHLDGVQAVAYGRLRLMDSDFQRVERQKKIMALCLEKAKTLDFQKLKVIIEAILPQVGYAFDFNEMIEIAKLAPIARITESSGCPDVSSVRTVAMGSNGDCVVPLNLQKSVSNLHKILFKNDNYTPSNSVKNYSARITELRHKYEEENKLKEQESENLEDESVVDESSEKKNSTTKKKVATRSNATASSKSTQTPQNNLPASNSDEVTERIESNNEPAPINIEMPNLNQQSSISDNNIPIVSPNLENQNVTLYEAPGVPVSRNINSPNQNTPNSIINPINNQESPVNGPPISNSAPNFNNNGPIAPMVVSPN